MFGYRRPSFLHGPGKWQYFSKISGKTGINPFSFCGGGQYYLADMVVLDSSLAFFFTCHTIFFFNRCLRYHMFYGIVLSFLCITVPSVAFSIIYRWDASDVIMPINYATIVTIFAASLTWLQCIWYSVETHAIVRCQHRFQFRTHDSIYAILCFSYIDVWNIMAKCQCFFQKKD